MKNIFLTLRSPALISLLILIPFMVMEVVNRRELNEGFPFLIFIIMWLLPMIFIIILVPLVRSVREGNRIAAKPISLALSLLFLVLIGLAWGGIVADQMPCFLGVPNCD